MSDRPPTGPRPPSSRPSGRRGPAGFDRIKAPQERRDEAAAGERGTRRADGRAALFDTVEAASGPASAAATEADARRAVSVAAVHCRSCDATSPLDLLTVLRGMVPFVVVPWADHPWWAVCPACGQRTWLRPEVLASGGRRGAQAPLSPSGGRRGAQAPGTGT